MSNKQRLVLSIIDFLNQSIQDGTVKQDDQESLEVASTYAQTHFIGLVTEFLFPVQCIGEAFAVDPSNDTQREQLSVKPATLESIFDVFIKTRSKLRDLRNGDDDLNLILFLPILKGKGIEMHLFC